MNALEIFVILLTIGIVWWLFYAMVVLFFDTPPKKRFLSFTPYCTCKDNPDGKHSLGCDLMYRNNTYPRRHKRVFFFYPMVEDSSSRSSLKYHFDKGLPQFAIKYVQRWR